MTRLSTTELRNRLAEVLDQVASGGERVIVHKHGKDKAVIIPLADWQLLQAAADAEDSGGIEILLQRVSKLERTVAEAKVRKE